MRRSLPMAEATSCTSAPTSSHRSAISLMKLIFRARKALAAYLASSADSRETNITGALRSGERLVEAVHHLARALAVGADQHAVGVREVLDGRALAQELGIGADGEVGIGAQRLRRRSISRLVPTGTVDLVVMTVKPSRMRRELLDGRKT